MHSINDDDDVLQYGTTKEPIDKQETKMEQDCCCGHPIYVQPVVGFIMVKFHYKVYRRINEVNNARQRPFKVSILCFIKFLHDGSIMKANAAFHPNITTQFLAQGTEDTIHKASCKCRRA